MGIHTVPPLTLINALAAIVIATLFIAIMSLVKEPSRQKINAFRALKHYYFIGIGWVLHTGSDILHHLYGKPIVYLEPSSSAGCAACDPILATWFFFGAPSVFNFFKRWPITAA